MTASSHDIICFGPWEFSPQTGLLSSIEPQTEITVRLENRAASLLEYLCTHQGALMSHDDIINHVWEGRFVSPNSVAVVISDIRRALGDDARNPHYIETLPKRGYRFIAAIKGAASPSDLDSPALTRPKTVKHFKTAFALIATITIGAAGFFSLRVWDGFAPPTKRQVVILPVINATEAPEYSALATSVSELVRVEIARHEPLQIVPKNQAEITVRGKLILWDGHPALSLHALSNKTGQTLWSGMASGPESQLPKQVRAEITELSIKALEGLGPLETSEKQSPPE